MIIFDTMYVQYTAFGRNATATVQRTLAIANGMNNVSYQLSQQLQNNYNGMTNQVSIGWYIAGVMKTIDVNTVSN